MSAVLSQLELVQSKTLAALVQQEVVRMICDGQLVAGARLVEAWFTSRLNINRSAVREAFRALDEAGLVRLEKNRGAFVREFSKAEGIELYEMRLCLEQAGGRRLASRITGPQLHELHALNNRLGSLAARNAIDQYYPLNVQFHFRLAEWSQHTVLLDLYRRLSHQIHLLPRTIYKTGDGLTRSHAEHAAILEALATRDAEAVSAAIKAHSQKGLERFLAA